MTAIEAAPFSSGLNSLLCHSFANSLLWDSCHFFSSLLDARVIYCRWYLFCCGALGPNSFFFESVNTLSSAHKEAWLASRMLCQMLALSLLTNQRDGFCGFVWSLNLGPLGTLCLVQFCFAHNYQREHFIPLSWVGTVTLFMGSELKFDFVIAWCSDFICVVCLLYYFALSHPSSSTSDGIWTLCGLVFLSSFSSWHCGALYSSQPWGSHSSTLSPLISMHIWFPFPMSSVVSPLLVPTPTC